MLHKHGNSYGIETLNVDLALEVIFHSTPEDTTVLVIIENLCIVIPRFSRLRNSRFRKFTGCSKNTNVSLGPFNG